MAYNTISIFHANEPLFTLYIRKHAVISTAWKKPETLFFFEQIKRQKFYFNLQSGNEPANFRGRRETKDEFIFFAFNLREVMQ